MDKRQKKEKTISAKFILGWVFGVFFLFSGAMDLPKRPISGIFAILAALVIFPPFMQIVKSKTGIKFSTALRIIIFLILLGIGTGLNLSIYKTNSSEITQVDTTSSNVKQTPTPTPIVFDISELIDQYDKNKVAVQSKYTGKEIQVNGFIEDISSDWDQYSIELAPTNEQYYFGTTIKCYFVNKDALVDFSKGQSITVVGTLKDTSYETWIELHDCSSVK